MKLTKEQILTGIVAPFVKLLSFLLALIPDKELVQEIVAETKTAIDGINVETPPTEKEAVYAALEIAETLAEGTATGVDDAVVDAAQAGAKFVYERGEGFKHFVALIRARFFAKKKAKEEAAAEPTAETPSQEEGKV